MAYSTNRGSGPEQPESGVGAAACPTCRSEDVHPSRSSYPMDEVRLRSVEEAFWRCQNCGDRFIGPASDRPSAADDSSARHGRHHQHHRRSRHHHHDRDLERSGVGRLVAPILLALAGIIAMLFLLDYRR